LNLVVEKLKSKVSETTLTACSVAPKTPDVGSLAATEEMFTMRPWEPQARIAATAALQPTSSARTFVSNMAR
jgi:hypothetical protein